MILKISYFFLNFWNLISERKKIWHFQIEFKFFQFKAQKTKNKNFYQHWQQEKTSFSSHNHHFYHHWRQLVNLEQKDTDQLLLNMLQLDMVVFCSVLFWEKSFSFFSFFLFRKWKTFFVLFIIKKKKKKKTIFLIEYFFLE